MSSKKYVELGRQFAHEQIKTVTGQAAVYLFATWLDERSRDETKANPYARTTDAAMWAFWERFGHVPMSTGDQQWVNGYARALQHTRTDSVPTGPPEKTTVADEPPGYPARKQS